MPKSLSIYDSGYTWNPRTLGPLPTQPPSRGAGPICLRDSFSLGKKDEAKVGLRIPNWANESGTEPHA